MPALERSIENTWLGENAWALATADERGQRALGRHLACAGDGIRHQRCAARGIEFLRREVAERVA